MGGGVQNLLFELTLDPKLPSQLAPGVLQNLLFEVIMDVESPSQLAPGGLQNLLFVLILDSKPPSQLAPGGSKIYFVSSPWIPNPMQIWPQGAAKSAF